MNSEEKRRNLEEKKNILCSVALKLIPCLVLSALTVCLIQAMNKVRSFLSKCSASSSSTYLLPHCTCHISSPFNQTRPGPRQ